MTTSDAKALAARLREYCKEQDYYDPDNIRYRAFIREAADALERLTAAPDMQPGSPTFDGADAWNAAPEPPLYRISKDDAGGIKVTTTPAAAPAEPVAWAEIGERVLMYRRKGDTYWHHMASRPEPPDSPARANYEYAWFVKETQA